MKRILTAIALQMSGMAALNAQQIRGIVKDDHGNAISNATVSLLKAKDSSVIKLELSKEGTFIFAAAPIDSLFVSVSYVGHQTYFTDRFLNHVGIEELPVITLTGINTSLQTVVVSAKKRLVEVRNDRTILNVEGTINATGSDALDLLRKAPGVSIDNEDKLSLNGKNGVRIYIDDKPSPLNGQDLGSFLKAMPSSQIEAIEIIHNPGAKYEASGTAGIINIRLKKGKAMGFNGSVNIGAGAGKNVREEGGVLFNYRNNKLNVFGSYSGDFGKLNSEFALERVIGDSAFSQQNKMQLRKENHLFKTGLDYAINSKNNLGFTVNGNVNSPGLSVAGITRIARYPTGEVDRILLAENVSRQHNVNINSNINYTYNDAHGKALIVNADYGYFNNKQDQFQPNTFYDATGKNEQYRRNYQISAPTRIDIYSLKVDYDQDFAKGKLGVGGKFGYVKTGNDFNQFNQSGNTWEMDKERSSFFNYDENVNTAYINYSGAFNRIAFQGGIRAEQTNIKGALKGFRNTGGGYIEETTGFTKNYVDFFPSMSITLSPKTKNQLTIAYSRRIDRPVYQDLNPFEYRINEYSYHKGSTSIRPQYSNMVSVTHTYKFKLNTTISYSHVKDLFGQLVDTAQGVKGYMVHSNIASQDIANLNISYPFQYHNYTLFTSVNAYYAKYKSGFGLDRDINLEVWAVNIFLQNSYRFGKGWSAELSGFYTSPSVWQGTLKTASIWSADAGLQRQLWNGKASIKASVSDVFKSMKWKATSNFAGQEVSGGGRFESRQVKLNFSWWFGNQKIKATRQYKTGLEEETNRAKGSGGLGQQ